MRIRCHDEVGGTNISHDFEEQVTSSSASLPASSRLINQRRPKQLEFMASAIRNLGCIPKFFCGQNSKNPSPDRCVHFNRFQ